MIWRAAGCDARPAYQKVTFLPRPLPQGAGPFRLDGASNRGRRAVEVILRKIVGVAFLQLTWSPTKLKPFPWEGVVAQRRGDEGFKGGAPLPPDCPPPDAIDVPKGVYLRLVAAKPTTADDFRSGHAEGKKKPDKCDECTWRACSVWVETTKLEKIAGLTKLRTLSDKKFIAFIEVDDKCGKIKPHPKDKEHLSFWMRKSFIVEKAIIKHVDL